MARPRPKRVAECPTTRTAHRPNPWPGRPRTSRRAQLQTASSRRPGTAGRGKPTVRRAPSPLARRSWSRNCTPLPPVDQHRQWRTSQSDSNCLSGAPKVRSEHGRHAVVAPTLAEPGGFGAPERGAVPGTTRWPSKPRLHMSSSASRTPAVGTRRSSRDLRGTGGWTPGGKGHRCLRRRAVYKRGQSSRAGA